MERRKYVCCFLLYKKQDKLGWTKQNDNENEI